MIHENRNQYCVLITHTQHFGNICLHGIFSFPRKRQHGSLLIYMEPVLLFWSCSVCFKGRNMTNIKAVVCAPCSTWSFEGRVLIEETSQLGFPCMLLEVSILDHSPWRRISNVTREHGIRINRRYIHQIKCRRDVMINR